MKKIDSLIANHKSLCEGVYVHNKINPDEFCRMFMEALHPNSIMIYVTSISDSFGRNVGRTLFKMYSLEILKFKPTLSHSSLLTLIWIVDLFIPGFRKALRIISEVLEG